MPVPTLNNNTVSEGSCHPLTKDGICGVLHATPSDYVTSKNSAASGFVGSCHPLTKQRTVLM